MTWAPIGLSHIKESYHRHEHEQEMAISKYLLDQLRTGMIVLSDIHNETSILLQFPSHMKLLIQTINILIKAHIMEYKFYSIFHSSL